MTRISKWFIIDKTHTDYDTINTAIQSSMTDVSNGVSQYDNNDGNKTCYKIDVSQSWWDAQTWQSSSAILIQHTGNNTGFKAELVSNNFVEQIPADYNPLGQ